MTQSNHDLDCAPGDVCGVLPLGGDLGHADGPRLHSLHEDRRGERTSSEVSYNFVVLIEVRVATSDATRVSL